MKKIKDWYRENWEKNLQGRYINLRHIVPLFDHYDDPFEVSEKGQSEAGRNIPLVKIGTGKKVILIWSQMHGNESTTTKALFDLFRFFNDKRILNDEKSIFLNAYTLVVVPILNPDGAENYTRENANGIDLNRDFLDHSQKESRYLHSLFTALQPIMCLNMHDQRTIYGLDTDKPATVSFLAPAANAERTLTDSRKIAMEGIVKMNHMLQSLIPGQVGRYDDSFNAACAGDAFQMEGVPTILFEAGHFQGDYRREKTRELIFYSLLTLFGILKTDCGSISYKEYFELPENKKSYRDFIFRNVSLPNFDDPVDISIQYQEVLTEDSIIFKPVIDDIGFLSDLVGHWEKNLNFKKVPMKFAINLTKGSDISKIFDKNNFSLTIFK